MFGKVQANYGALLANGTNNAGMLLGTVSNTPIIFGTNNIERLKIDNLGAITSTM